ncbi:MAG: PAS domain S-box protein [Syntrophorhabdaceae bacterium]|nr:PAS domain S-box protein [Syntrophorhabdales bacterium]MBP9560533.1 PAS domain S-box protein [Syntrophorhabdaceae bacterium]
MPARKKRGVSGLVNEMLQSEKGLSEIIPLISDVLWEINEDDICVFINKEAEKVMGYKAEDFIGKMPFDFMTPEEAQRTKEIYNQLKKEKRSFAFIECQFVHKNGNITDAEISGVPIYNERGRFCGYLGIHRDITLRKRLERSLMEQEADLKMESFRLNEINNALNILVRQKENEKKDLENSVVTNIKELVLPYLSELKKTGLDAKQQALVDIMQANINNIVSPFVQKITSKYINLTPTEIKIASFIKEGKTAKAIAQILNVSESAVNLHRQHVRDKLGLSKKKIGLRTYLMSMMH